MARVAELQFRANSIVDFYRKHDNNKAMTAAHFSMQNIDRSVIYRVIKRFEERGTTTFAKKTGRPRTETTPQLIKKIDKTLERDPNISIRNLASSMKVSRCTAQRAKVEAGWKSRRCLNAPNTTPEQEKRIVTGATRIYKKLTPSGGGKILIMDDESYFPADPNQVAGPKNFSFKPGFEVPVKCMVKPKLKFFKKYLVWQALDAAGNVSKPFICEGTINGELYLKECLQKRLVPFIDQHHARDQVLFWPDMATSHYSKDCTAWLASQNIDFVSKQENTPNFPQGRPIELFWALVKKEYAKRSRPAKNLVDFKRIYKVISERVAERSGKTLMEGTKRKLRITRDEGAFGVIKVKLPPLRPSSKINNK